jgi:hypothetical protein
MKSVSLILTMVATLNATNSANNNAAINPLFNDDFQAEFNPVFTQNIRVLRWRMLLDEIAQQELRRLKKRREPSLATIEEGPIDFSFEIDKALGVIENQASK